jgi:CheY-like chemotaxis protein
MADAPVHTLFAEDDADDGLLTLRALRKAGVVDGVQWVRDGDEALAVLQASPSGAERVRLVLLDLQMPRLGGFEVLRALKENPRTRDIPVVVFTSSAHESDRERSLALGAAAFVTKPVETAAFEQSVRQLVERWLAPVAC